MTKYEQIAQDIEELIQSGKYKTGDKLPSIVEQSKKYDCSRGTVIRAYQYLLERNFIYVKHKSGYYVAVAPVTEAINDSFHLESGNPMVGSFPLSYAKQSLALALDEYHFESLDIGYKGVSSVTQLLSERLGDSYIYTQASGIHLTMGIQGVVHALCEMSFPNQRKNILIEEPSYAFIVDLLKSHTELRIYTIQRTTDGFNLKELERIFQTEEIKFFYLVPRNHNPLGTSLSSQQRKKIIALSQKYDVYLAEDDYFMDTFHIPNYEPLHYLSGGDRCIYLGSFTKILPYLRIGFTIMPHELRQIYIDKVDDLMKFGYYTPPLISQTMLAVLLSNHSLEISKNLLKRDLQDKITAVQKYTKKWPTSILSYTGYHGYYATIQLHPKISVNRYIQELEQRRIYIRSNLESFYLEENFDNSVRVSLAKISAEDIHEVYPILKQVAEKLYEE